MILNEEPLRPRVHERRKGNLEEGTVGYEDDRSSRRQSPLLHGSDQRLIELLRELRQFPIPLALDSRKEIVDPRRKTLPITRD